MKKGFTLIELLAVIVILAIIAVIAVPIVINIIEDSKKNAKLRSAEMYMDAVEMAVANRVMHHGKIDDGSYDIMSNGYICLGEYVITKEDGKIKSETCAENPIDPNNEKVLTVEINGEGPTSGKVVIENGEIVDKLSTDSNQKTTLEISGQTITKNENNEFVIIEETDKEEKMEVGKFRSVCKPAEGTKYNTTAGTKYNCKVDPNKPEYIFYVLTTPTSTDTSINLIMDRNICDDGTPTAEGKKCLVAWQTSGINSDGPVTAMDYLYKATKDWINIQNIEMNYTDERNTGSYGYGTIITTNNITKITKKDGTAVAVLTDQEGYSNLKARIPYECEVLDSNEFNNYLYENLAKTGLWYGSGAQPTNNISGIQGYWILSSNTSAQFAEHVDYCGNVHQVQVNLVDRFGIRPVINLKL